MLVYPSLIDAYTSLYLFQHLQVRSQVAYGSVGEVDRFESMVGVKAMQAA